MHLAYIKRAAFVLLDKAIFQRLFRHPLWTLLLGTYRNNANEKKRLGFFFSLVLPSVSERSGLFLYCNASQLCGSDGSSTNEEYAHKRNRNSERAKTKCEVLRWHLWAMWAHVNKNEKLYEKYVGAMQKTIISSLGAKINTSILSLTTINLCLYTMRSKGFYDGG